MNERDRLTLNDGGGGATPRRKHKDSHRKEIFLTSFIV
jgi:hypothetical protein